MRGSTLAKIVTSWKLHGEHAWKCLKVENGALKLRENVGKLKMERRRGVIFVESCEVARRS